MTHPDLSKLLPTALEASLKAGEAIMDVYGSFDFQLSLKTDRSPLTRADQRSHGILQEALSGTGIPVLSEEGRLAPYSERKAWSSFWLVDPLDGTKEFVNRNGEFTVNVALIQGDKPVLGVIYVPVEQSLYYAAQGLGAWELDEVTAKDFEGTGRAEKLPRDFRAPQGVLRVAASRSHLTPETQAFIDQEGKGRKVELTPAGSSMKFCLVAEGLTDLYPRFGPTMEWDTAAGQALVEQAGGSVVNSVTGLPLAYNKEDLHNPFFVARGPKGPP